LPDREFSGIGGISTFEHALSYFLLGCGTVQVATAAMLDHAIGPNVIRGLVDGMTDFLERNAYRGWSSLADFRGLLRDRVVAHAAIARPDAAGYRGGYEDEEAEGYAREREPAGAAGTAR
jgi:dihydropyrimidine dehydrogenase (NAD+) subunit PreA